MAPPEAAPQGPPDVPSVQRAPRDAAHFHSIHVLCLGPELLPAFFIGSLAAPLGCSDAYDVFNNGQGHLHSLIACSPLFSLSSPNSWQVPWMAVGLTFERPVVMFLFLCSRTTILTVHPWLAIQHHTCFQAHKIKGWKNTQTKYTTCMADHQLRAFAVHPSVKAHREVFGDIFISWEPMRTFRI